MGMENVAMIYTVIVENTLLNLFVLQISVAFHRHKQSDKNVKNHGNTYFM